MFCRNCGKELDDKAVVCVGCGVPPLKGCKHCQSCGKEVDEAAVACVSCGVKLQQAGAIGGDDKMWSMLAHLSMLLFWFVGPLVIWLIKKNESELVDDQGREALNFAITWSLCVVALQVVSFIMVHIFWLLGLLVSLLLGVVGIGVLVMAIMAAIQANSGNRYRYPFCIRLVK